VADRQRLVEGGKVADVVGQEAASRDVGHRCHDAAVLGAHPNSAHAYGPPRKG
jgi:hypothetical protein